MFVLDTNVVSEFRKARTGRADVNVVAWASGVSAASMFISVITVQELEVGVLRAERLDPPQGVLLRRWFEEAVLPTFVDRVIPLDVTVARRGALLQGPDPLPDRDALIAATALVHGMTVATRNVADFAPMGTRVVNPWEAADELS